MDTENPDPLIAEIEQFLAESGMSATTFGRYALNDPNFVFGLRSGRDCRLSTALRVRQQMQQWRQNFGTPSADATEQDLSASPRAEGAAAPSRSPITTTQQRT